MDSSMKGGKTTTNKQTLFFIWLQLQSREASYVHPICGKTSYPIPNTLHKPQNIYSYWAGNEKVKLLI